MTTATSLKWLCCLDCVTCRGVATRLQISSKSNTLPTIQTIHCILPWKPSWWEWRWIRYILWVNYQVSTLLNPGYLPTLTTILTLYPKLLSYPLTPPHHTILWWIETLTETTHQIRPKRSTTETTRAEIIQAKLHKSEMAQSETIRFQKNNTFNRRKEFPKWSQEKSTK